MTPHLIISRAHLRLSLAWLSRLSGPPLVDISRLEGKWGGYKVVITIFVNKSHISVLGRHHIFVWRKNPSLCKEGKGYIKKTLYSCIKKASYLCMKTTSYLVHQKLANSMLHQLFLILPIIFPTINIWLY